MESVSEKAPYPPSPVIRRAAFAKEIRRSAIDSDNWPLTWGDDDTQYTSYGDGFGFEPHVEKKLGMGFARITGGPSEYRGENLRSDGERTGDGAKSEASGIRWWTAHCTVGAQRGVRNCCGRGIGARRGNRDSRWNRIRSPAFLNFGRNYAARGTFVYTYSQDGPRRTKATTESCWRERRRTASALRLGFASARPGGRPYGRRTSRAAASSSLSANCQRVDAVYNRHRPVSLALGYDHAGGWGLFDAPEPWGPWTTVLHRSGTWRNVDIACRPSGLGDGLTMTLVFSASSRTTRFARER
jgi:hypothetical protein